MTPTEHYGQPDCGKDTLGALESLVATPTEPEKCPKAGTTHMGCGICHPLSHLKAPPEKKEDWKNEFDEKYQSKENDTRVISLGLSPMWANDIKDFIRNKKEEWEQEALSKVDFVKMAKLIRDSIQDQIDCGLEQAKKKAKEEIVRELYGCFESQLESDAWIEEIKGKFMKVLEAAKNPNS